MFPSWDPELKPHGPPSPPPLYPSACAAPPGTLNISPCSCFLVHSPSLRTYCWWFTPVLGPRPAEGKEREGGITLQKVGCLKSLNPWSLKRLLFLQQMYPADKGKHPQCQAGLRDSPDTSYIFFINYAHVLSCFKSRHHFPISYPL